MNMMSRDEFRVQFGALVMLGAIACGEAAELVSPGDPSAGNGGSSNGGSSSLDEGAAGDASGGRGVLSPAAPECTSDDPAFADFVAIDVLGVFGVRAELDGRVVGQGMGLPEGVSELPRGAESAEEVGWLQLEGSPAGDAGADAGAGPRWTLVGPRELGEMPVPTGESMQVRLERRSGPFYAAQHAEVVATLGERVVLFQQTTERQEEKLGIREGFLLESGAPVCHRVVWRTPTGAPCYYNYYHGLNVTLPGGEKASLALGERITLGDYRLLHGTTSSLSEPAAPFNQGAGECNDIEPWPSQFTAILAPASP